MSTDVLCASSSAEIGIDQSSSVKVQHIIFKQAVQRKSFANMWPKKYTSVMLYFPVKTNNFNSVVLFSHSSQEFVPSMLTLNVI